MFRMINLGGIVFAIAIALPVMIVIGLMGCARQPPGGDLWKAIGQDGKPKSSQSRSSQSLP